MKSTITTNNAPAAIGPYSQAVNTGSLIFVSGQIPVDPKTGKIPETIGEMTAQCLSNAKNILEAAGSSLDKAVKTTVFLRDMGDFDEMNKVYASFFTEGSYPARSAVEVAKLPKNVRIEIEVIAIP